MRLKRDDPLALVEGDDEVFEDVLADEIEVRGQVRGEPDFDFVPDVSDLNRNDVRIEWNESAIAHHRITHRTRARPAHLHTPTIIQLTAPARVQLTVPELSQLSHSSPGGHKAGEAKEAIPNPFARIVGCCE